MIFNKFFNIAKENGISESEISINKSTSFSFSLFKKELVSYTVDSSRKISARGIFNGKIGFGSTEDDSPKTSEFLINAIKETASLSESQDEPIIFKGADKYKKKNIYSKKLAEWQTEDKIKLCRAIEEKLTTADPRVSDVQVEYQDIESEKTFANSYGLVLKEKGNYFIIVASVVIKDGDEIKSNLDIFLETDPEKFNIDEFCDGIVKKGLEKFYVYIYIIFIWLWI